MQKTHGASGLVDAAVLGMLTLLPLTAPTGCGGAKTVYVTGGAGTGGAAAGSGGGAGAAGGAAGAAGADGGVDSQPDVAMDFGAPAPDGPVRCPTASGALAPAAAELVIDDFDGTGRLDGRLRQTAAFSVKEQFDATASATFDPAPSIETTCGAAAPGAAHIHGRAADTGATFAIVFKTAVEGGAPVARYDASATKGITFRVALGDPKASKLLSVQVNLMQATPWDYTKDVTVAGTAWQTVTILWTDLGAAAGATAFDPALLNQIVFPFFADTDVDLYIDDLAFVK
jgi:hypothetical protein